MVKSNYRLFKKDFFERGKSKGDSVFNIASNPFEIGWISATKDFILSF